MTQDKRPSDFAARLQRIEETRQTQPRPTAEELGIVPEKSPYARPQENHFVRNTLIWLALFAAGGIGSFHAIQMLPHDLKAILGLGEDAVAVASIDGMTTERPVISETDTMSDHGATLQSPLVASQQSEPLALSDIATDVVLPTGNTLLGNIIPFDRNVTCRLRKPLSTEKIMNVRLQAGLLPAPVQAFANTDLANRLLQNVAAVTQDGKPYDTDAQISSDLQSVDVFLTDTSAPIYLVLQNMGGGILWNIHTAPDVTVAHIAVVSSGFSGLVNPPDNASFDALLVRDFIESYQFGADDNVRDCMIRPWRNPQPDWIASQRAEASNAPLENQVTSYAKGYAAYNRWYTDTLGVDAGTNVVAPRDAAHVLLGPVPEEPIAYKAMAGQDIHIMRTDHIITGDSATRARQTKALHTQTMLTAIGNDMAALDPPAMERSRP